MRSCMMSQPDRPPVSLVHSATLFLNVLACLAYFTANAANAVDFGLSILWFILFTPVSFVCWYRPVYKAFRYSAFEVGCGRSVRQTGQISTGGKFVSIPRAKC